MNSINWIVRLSIGFDGGALLYGCLFTHIMSGLNLALHWHLCFSYEHASSRGGTVVS